MRRSLAALPCSPEPSPSTNRLPCRKFDFPDISLLEKPKPHGEATGDEAPCGGSTEASGGGPKQPSWRKNLQPRLPQLTRGDWPANRPRPSGHQLAMDV